VSRVYFNRERAEVKRVAGYILLVIAFLINIPLQAGIGVYGLVYAIRAFVDGNISTGIIAVAVTVICVAIAHFVVGRVLRPMNGLVTSLLGKTDVETISRDEREWRRKQAEKGYSEGKRSILDAEAQHIKDSLGAFPSSDLSRNRQRRG
jgi:hypothetical protein